MNSKKTPKVDSHFKETISKTVEDRLKDLAGCVAAARSDEKSATEANLRLNHMRVAMFDSLMIEREDLMVRIRRIDQRVKILGLEQPNAEPDLRQYAFDGSAGTWKSISQWKKPSA